jgi:hypothetical protein
MTPSPSPNSTSTVAIESASWLTPSLVISTCALLFTIGSFWWLNARRGKLRSPRPHSFAAAFTPHDLLINLPLILHNTGAPAVVVQDFRLRLDKSTERKVRERLELEEKARQANADQDDDALAEAIEELSKLQALPIQLSWRATRPGLQPESGSRPLAAIFPIEGRKAETRFIEFGRRNPHHLPLKGPYDATVEVKVSHRKRWQRLASFELHTELVEHPNQYIAHSNDPEWEP